MMKPSAAFDERPPNALSRGRQAGPSQQYGPREAPWLAASNGKPAAVFLAPEAPYPVVGGGALRSASLLEYLARRYEVDAILFRQPDGPDPAAALPPGLVRRVEVIDLPRHSRRAPARVARNLWRAFHSAPPLNDRFGGFGARVARAIEEREYHLAVVEHFWCAPYCEQLAQRSRKVVLDLHNVESVFYSRAAAAERWPASLLMRRFAGACQELERIWLPRFTCLLVTSAADAAKVEQICRGLRTVIYPNSIPLVSLPDEPEEESIVFSGNMEYHPNVLAVRYFRKKIWPKLRDRWPLLTWKLVGKNAEAVRKYVDGDRRIRLTGPVDDSLLSLAAAKAAVVPLLSGSGTRIKILEAWAAGRPVISTTVGAEGLPAVPGEHLLLADDPDLFAEAVSAVLGSHSLRQRLGSAGRRLYEECFTWDRAWSLLDRAGDLAT